jgi:CzcA family heavy metal efflux pump
MMRWLVRSSLELRVAIVALAAILMAFGFSIARDTPIDVFPEFAPPRVEIQTEAPGLSSSEVEALITVPLENALSGTAWVDTLRSKSVPGLSSVLLIFEPGTDLMRARQLVQERVAIVIPQLPDVAPPPVILAPLSSTSRAMKIGLQSEELSLIELSTLARWTIRPRLTAIPGVANVAIWGQRDRQLQVLVDPARLEANDLSIDEVMRAAGDATRPAAGGFLDMPLQRLNVTHLSPIEDAEDLAQVVVRTNAEGVLTLGDVADVVEGHQPLIGDGVINDELGILLIVEKQPWGNTLEVSLEVEKALEAMKPGLKGVHVDSTIFRPATFIERSIDNLTSALFIGCILVILVLGAFLYEWRTALISVLAIPLSLVAAGIVLHYLGGTINTMVLAGLVIALGEVVDDAIIDVENIVRRLRIERTVDSPRSAFQVVLEASLEMRSAIVYATMIVILALLPVFLLEGLSGAFFRPLAAAYALAVLASMFVALTVTPALSLLLLPHAPLEERESPITTKLKDRYAAWLPTMFGKHRFAMGVLGVLFVVAAAIYPFLAEEFLPRFKERDFLMHWVTKPGTSLPAMNRVTIAASKELRAIPGVRNFGAHVGRAEVADEVVGINFTELWISIDEEADYDETLAKVQEVVDGYPGLYRDVLTYLKERIKEVLTGSSASVVVRIYGPDLDVLRDQAAQVGAAISKVEGVVDLKVEPQVNIPQLEVKVDLAKAQQHGLTPGEVRRAAQTMVLGTKVGEIYEQQKIFDVVVWGAPHIRRDPTSMRRMEVQTPRGDLIPLEAVADVRIGPAPNSIKREGASRRIDVGFHVKGRALGDVVTDAKAALAKVEFPTGFHPEVLGEYAEREAASARINTLGLLSVIGIVLILFTAFGSTRLTVLMFLTLPFALVGGVLAALLTGGVLSLGSLVGFVTVLGIAARNGIMLMSHYQHLEDEEGMTFGPELVLRGSVERLAPILMTVLTTSLALIPLVIAGERPGHEIEHPMAVVILGGLVTSTVLNLVFVPALYLAFGKKR